MKTILLLFAFGLVSFAHAQGYPSKPVRIIVPFAPGGGADLTTRVIAQALSGPLGQQIIVDNRPGAGGTIGAEAGVKSPPDGYTLTMVTSGYPVYPSLYKLTFDPIRDITPVVLVTTTPFVICVHPSLPVASVKELIALAKRAPGEITFASAGPGSGVHMATELFLFRTGVRMNHIPYKGGGPAVSDLIAGHVAVAFAAAAAALPHVKANRLRALAVTSAERFASEPEIPTVAESGVPGYDVLDWSGLIAPRAVPRPIVERLNDETNKALRRREVADRYQQQSLTPAGGDPEQFLERIRREMDTWRDVVAKAKIVVN
jgi:tripartite-type tricarboxylate transporter receptor subunit TctC